MGASTSKFLLFILSTFLLAFVGKAQKIDVTISDESIKTPKQTLEGYGIILDFPKKKIFKAWWKFSKEFSRNETRKDQIRHAIPPVDGESTVPVVFYSEITAPDSLTSKLKAAINDNGLSSDNIKKYSAQVRQLLIDFKVEYYRNNLQRKISSTEKQASRISKNLDKYVTNEIKLQQKIDFYEKKKEQTPDDLIEVDNLKLQIVINQNRKDSINHELNKINKRLDGIREMAGEIGN